MGSLQFRDIQPARPAPTSIRPALEETLPTWGCALRPAVRAERGCKLLHKVQSCRRNRPVSKLTHKAEPFAKALACFWAQRLRQEYPLFDSAVGGRRKRGRHHDAGRLGAVNDSRVEPLWASGATIAYSVCKWKASTGKIHIFDQEYISKRTCTSDPPLPGLMPRSHAYQARPSFKPGRRPKVSEARLMRRRS